MAILTKNHHVQEIRPNQKHVVYVSPKLFTEMHCVFKSFTVCDRLAWDFDFWAASSGGSIALRVTSDTLGHCKSVAG